MRIPLTTLALSLSSALLAACAAEPAPPSTVPEAAATQSDVVCSREYPTGSNMAVTKCRSREQAEMEKAVAERTLGHPNSGTGLSPGGAKSP